MVKIFRGEKELECAARIIRRKLSISRKQFSLSELIQGVALDRGHTHFFEGDRHSGGKPRWEEEEWPKQPGEAWSVCLGGERQELAGIWMGTI